MCCQLETPEFVRLFCLLGVAAAPPPAWPSSPDWVTFSSQQLGLAARSAVLGTCGNPSRQVSNTAPLSGWARVDREGTSAEQQQLCLSTLSGKDASSSGRFGSRTTLQHNPLVSCSSCATVQVLPARGRAPGHPSHLLRLRRREGGKDALNAPQHCPDLSPLRAEQMLLQR